MDVGNKLSPETKSLLAGKVIEFQVLSNLASNHKAELQTLGNKAIEEAGISPEKYDMEVDPQNGIFSVREKVVPQTTPVTPKVELPPAGDTKTDAVVPGEVKV